MPIFITENDVDAQVIITQRGTDPPTVIVNASTRTDRPDTPGRALPSEEVYSKLGVQAQTLVRSIMTSIRNRVKTQEGI